MKISKDTLCSALNCVKGKTPKYIKNICENVCKLYCSKEYHKPDNINYWTNKQSEFVEVNDEKIMSVIIERRLYDSEN